MSMDSTHNMPGPPKDQKAAEEALTKLLREATAIASDRCTDMARSNTLRAAGPSVDAMLGPVADLKDDRFPGTPSPGRRASRVLSRFLILAVIGVGCTLAWQSYGEAAKKKLARWAPQLGWVQLGPRLKPSEIALATAGPIGGTPGSPTPVGRSELGTMWTSICGTRRPGRRWNTSLAMEMAVTALGEPA